MFLRKISLCFVAVATILMVVDESTVEAFQYGYGGYRPAIQDISGSRGQKKSRRRGRRSPKPNVPKKNAVQSQVRPLGIGVYGPAIHDISGSRGRKESRRRGRRRPKPNVPKKNAVQSPVRPLGMGVYGPVMEAGSGKRAKEFKDKHLKNIFAQASKLVASNKRFDNRASHKLDSSRLFLTSRTKYPVRVYFISEGAGFHNSVGCAINLAGSKEKGVQKLIFPDASMPGNGFNININNLRARSRNFPCHPGDYVELGNLGAGVQLDFFIVRDGARGGRDVFTNHDHLNPDKIQHCFAMVLPNTPFLLVGFEDLLGGGDLDFEDVLFVVDIGLENAKNLGRINALPQ